MTSSELPDPYSRPIPQPPAARWAPHSLGRWLRAVAFPARRNPFPQQPADGVGPRPTGAPDEPAGPDRAPRHAHDEADLVPVPDSQPAFVAVLSPSGCLLDEPLPSPADPVEWLAVDAVGHHLWDAPWWSWSPDVQERLRAAVRRAGSGEVVSYADTVRLRGNRLVSVGLTVAPVVSPAGVTGVRCSVLDPDDVASAGRHAAPRHLDSAGTIDPPVA